MKVHGGITKMQNNPYVLQVRRANNYAASEKKLRSLRTTKEKAKLKGS